MNATAQLPHQYRNDEIDLRALLKSLWAQKSLILAVALTVAAIGACYVFLATPQYQVQSLVRPAALKDLDELNATGLYQLTPANALKRVGAAAESFGVRLQFFRDNPDLLAPLLQADQSPEQTFERFNREAFSVLQPDPKKTSGFSSYVGLSLTYPAGVDGVGIVNGLINSVIESERNRIREDFKAVVANRLALVQSQMAAQRASYEAGKEARIAALLETDRLKKNLLQDELNALRQQLQTRRQNRIKQLDEAILIAGQLGIAKPTTPAALGESGREVQGSVIRTEVNNQQIPLYFMGVEALQAERAALVARRSDDFTEPRISEIQKELSLLAHGREVESLRQRENEDLFLKNLGQLREEKARLEGLHVDFSRIQLVDIDQVAVAPQAPIKPRKILILGLGLMLGLMLGVFAAMLRVMFERPAEAHATTSRHLFEAAYS
ncbi:chain-length determining protein [Pseudomonas cavernae]|uniref:Chain-length determining protein n=1 Tax=Pseudomonas cavernae TaxID=2320867 RepID=A0A385Z2P1_9PSED|nr:Wzz/FepE/Etk N-terminal domain-containing protein [Pseudomonas cavernae]AYC32153.1 chain-length determining protein [Pseudomonas cavernae]